MSARLLYVLFLKEKCISFSDVLLNVSRYCFILGSISDSARFIFQESFILEESTSMTKSLFSAPKRISPWLAYSQVMIFAGFCCASFITSCFFIDSSSKMFLCPNNSNFSVKVYNCCEGVCEWSTVTDTFFAFAFSQESSPFPNFFFNSFSMYWLGKNVTFRSIG